jgi:hypothetical protein
MKKSARIVTLVAAGWVAFGLAGLIGPDTAGAADRKPVDATKPGSGYWSQGKDQSKEQGNRQSSGAESDYHANYHADYSVKTGSGSTPSDAARDPRDARTLRDPREFRDPSAPYAPNAIDPWRHSRPPSAWRR